MAGRHLNVLRCVTLVLPLSLFPTNYRLGLLSAGYLWLFALPLPQLGIDTYVDENALQPSQVPLSTSAYTMRADYIHV